MKQRVLFTLSMPNCNSWNGKWSGEGRNYTIQKSFSQKTIDKLFPDGKDTVYWHYNFTDGWSAGITARIMDKGERAKKSDGFCSYSWMVDNIIFYGQIEKPEVLTKEK